MVMASTEKRSKTHVKAVDDRDTETLAYVMTATGVTGSSNSTGIDLGKCRVGSFDIAVTNSGADTYNCTATVQTSPDNSTWLTVVAFTAFTANTTEIKGPFAVDRYLRVAWVKNTGTMVAEQIVVNGRLNT